MAEACCTCATLLSNITPLYDENTEKPKALDRRLECCNRVICGTCIYVGHNLPDSIPVTYINADYRIIRALEITVSPQLSPFPLPLDHISNNNSLTGVFCQISIIPTSLPQGLRNPPLYTSPAPPPPSYTNDSLHDSTLPPYPSSPPLPASHPSLAPEKSFTAASAPDVLHFLNHSTDSVLSLSMLYRIPISALRRANGITSDHLLLARRTVLIPGEFYKGGVSLSPRPVEGEEEEARKGKIRRWMVRCKVAEWVLFFIFLRVFLVLSPGFSRCGGEEEGGI
jgi:hypothetical protein